MPYSDKILITTVTRGTSAVSDATDPTIGTGLSGAPECGDVMKLQIKVNPETAHRGREIQDVRLRLRYGIQQPSDRMAEGQDGR